MYNCRPPTKCLAFTYLLLLEGRYICYILVLNIIKETEIKKKIALMKLIYKTASKFLFNGLKPKNYSPLCTLQNLPTMHSTYSIYIVYIVIISTFVVVIVKNSSK